MRKKIDFVLGSRYHIPISAGDGEVEELYNDKIKPFVMTLYKYPKIQATLYYSGVLLQKLETSHPEFSMIITDLLSRKQIELLGGAFYEPLLPLLPFSDRIGQIELFTTYLRRQFSKRPQGCMIPLFAWETQLVSALNTCGMNYTFLSESQFRESGLFGESIAPCITEDQGKIITVFPVLNHIERLFAEKRAGDVIRQIINEEKKKTICVFPEKFFSENLGESQEDIFHRVFDDISAYEGEVEFTQASKLFKSNAVLKKVYFPTSLQNSIFASQNKSPRQFLINYPAANNIYAKMLFTHALIHHLRGDKERKKTAREELWKSQGYDSFCPTVEGGIFSNQVRKTAYSALLEAEKLTRENGHFIPSLAYFDFDFDGEGEIIFQGEELNCYIKHEGASIFELDYLPKTWNYLDTFGKGFKRASFADMLVSENITFQDFLEGELTQKTGRFCDSERFELVNMDKESLRVYFSLPVNPDKSYGNISIEKNYHFKGDTISVEYVFHNLGDVSESFQFIPSINISFAVSEESKHISDTDSVVLQDSRNETQLVMSSNQRFGMWIKPMYSPCFVRGLVENVYQSTCMMPVKRIVLAAGDSFQIAFSLQIRQQI